MTDLLIYLERLFNSSPLLSLAISYLAGVVASFSPCVYPLIPITLSIVGSASTESKLKGFWLSFIFVLGMCCTYTVLGILASLMGVILSSFFIHPITYIFLGLIFIVLSLSILDIISLPFFSISKELDNQKGFISLFVFGIISGFGFIPCNFPVLGAILSIISLKKNIFFGAAALFLFSLGFGTLLIIVGTFSTLMRKLPKSGKWLIFIKRSLAILLIIMGIYFLIKGISLIN